jgi:hypothetical protein
MCCGEYKTSSFTWRLLNIFFITKLLKLRSIAMPRGCCPRVLDG